ncbi:MAG: hypothetical protein AB7R89_23935, partial [Dehalococcoidia bacterium]
PASGGIGWAGPALALLAPSAAHTVVHRPVPVTAMPVPTDPLVDEHVEGAIFVAFGENRYLGGWNESSLNVDFALTIASLYVDDDLVVERGRLHF